ncbi:hypothetical protein [Escherichia phage vB_EcoM_JNE01]|nr:hypothetical protein [Escherichia phage vB_EcoM_JNE01]
MMTFFGIYGFVAICSFVCNFIVLNWGCFKDELITIISLQSAALMAIIWPVTLVYLLISLVRDVKDKYVKNSKKGEKHD